MEEIDKIIIESLRNLQCDFEEDITSLKQFDVNSIVGAISACLEAITPGIALPRSLPPSMTLKLKITSNLAEQIKDLGFQGDMGYQTILYCNETEIRRVLMFLIERLPRESSKSEHVEQVGYVPTLVKAIEKRVRKDMETFWLPFGLAPDFIPSSQAKTLKIPQTHLHPDNEVLRQYWVHDLPEITKQCQPEELLVSVVYGDDSRVEYPNDSLLKCLKLPTKKMQEVSSSVSIASSHQDITNSESLANISVENSSGDLAREENSVSELLERLKNQKSQYDELEANIQKLEIELSVNENALQDEETVLKNTLSQITLKSKTLTVLSKEENLQKLKNMIENSNNKLLQLAEQWNEIQTPLLDEYKTLQTSLSNQDLKAQEELQKMKKLRETFVALETDLSTKTSLEQQLKQKLEGLNKNHNRANYTRRIIEIIGNIKKQDDEIQKILNDTKEIQREINQLTGQVDRSFTLSDELIFRDAKQDETARKSYKLLAQLRDECSNIIKAVTDLGLLERESRHLQDQIEIEATKDTATKLDRVEKDLQEIRKEVAEMQQ